VGYQYENLHAIAVNECQVNFGFLPDKSQIFIRTARFLQKFIASENSLCTSFVNDARQHYYYYYYYF